MLSRASAIGDVTKMALDTTINASGRGHGTTLLILTSPNAPSGARGLRVD